MPIFRIDHRLCYFAHVPKCAGTAVEFYLADRFGPLGFQDRKHLKVPAKDRWSKSSPQHIDVATLGRLLPPFFFATGFALVRNPARRILSVFRYQRDIERKFPLKTPFHDWLAALPARRKSNPFYLDNHPRPMSDLVPGEAKVFRLEEGTRAVVDWLDDLAGARSGVREIPTHNGYHQQLYQRRLKPGPEITVTDRDRALIAELYAVDFERFGYDARDDDAAGADR